MSTAALPTTCPSTHLSPEAAYDLGWEDDLSADNVHTDASPPRGHRVAGTRDGAATDGDDGGTHARLTFDDDPAAAWHYWVASILRHQETKTPHPAPQDSGAPFSPIFLGHTTPRTSTQLSQRPNMTSDGKTTYPPATYTRTRLRPSAIGTPARGAARPPTVMTETTTPGRPST